jgi:hypothetical protein
MKISAIIFGIILISATTIIPAQAGGMGGGIGGGMGGGMGGGTMGNLGNALMNWFQKWQNERRDTASHNDQSKQIEELNKKHYEDSLNLKYQIQMKEKELESLLKSTNPDIEKLRAVNREIHELRSLAEQEQRNYELEMDRMTHGYRSGSSR